MIVYSLLFPYTSSNAVANRKLLLLLLLLFLSSSLVSA